MGVDEEDDRGASVFYWLCTWNGCLRLCYERHVLPCQGDSLWLSHFSVLQKISFWTGLQKPNDISSFVWPQEIFLPEKCAADCHKFVWNENAKYTLFHSTFTVSWSPVMRGKKWENLNAIELSRSALKLAEKGCAREKISLIPRHYVHALFVWNLPLSSHAEALAVGLSQKKSQLKHRRANTP